KPERLLDLELGANWDGARHRFSANVYWMEFWDEIVPSGGLDQFGVPRSGNADRSRHIGLEVEASIALGRLDLFGDGTLSRNRYLHFTEFVSDASGAATAFDRKASPIAGCSDRIANVGARYEIRSLTIRLASKSAGKQYIDNSG